MREREKRKLEDLFQRESKRKKRIIGRVKISDLREWVQDEDREDEDREKVNR